MYRLLLEFWRFSSGFLQGFKRLVEFGDNDSHRQGEEDHGTEDENSCYNLP